MLERIGAGGITLNLERCEFSKGKIKFLGQVMDEIRIHQDPCKGAVIQDMKELRNAGELR